MLVAESAIAAPRADSAAIPMGTARLNKGTQQVTYKLPSDVNGPLDHGMLFWAINPRRAAPPPKNVAEIVNPPNPGRAPCDVTIEVGGNKLPKWTWGDRMSGFVLHPKTLRENNPLYDKGAIQLTITLDGEPATADFTVSSLPELGVLHPTAFNGTLDDLAKNATDPDVRQYFEALALEVGNDYSAALERYKALAASKNSEVARFARRGRRLLRYHMRPYKLSGNFLEHYRWGLFAQQCGLYGIGKLEFDECRILNPDAVSSQIHCAEMTDHVGAPFLDVQDYLLRAITAAYNRFKLVREAGDDTALYETTEWNVLVVILRSRDYSDAEAGAPVKQTRTLKAGEISQIKNLFLLAARMIQGATESRLRFVPSFFEIDDESQYPYVNYADAVGPSPEIIEERGWFDGMISVRPRIPSDKERGLITVSAQVGPKGVGLSDVFEDADIQVLTTALYEQLADAAARNEAGPGLPTGAALLSAGHQPIPNMGYACRAALRYYLTPAMIWRLRNSEVSQHEDHLRFWSVRGPFPITDKPSTDGVSAPHVLDPIPQDGKPATIIESPTPFVDMAKLFPNAGWARAAAECWVFSPVEQDVHLFMGQSRGVAARVNGRIVHRGRRYAAESARPGQGVDTVTSFASLSPGWNHVEVVVESPQNASSGPWGFSLRITDRHARALTGLAFAAGKPGQDVVAPAAPPETGAYFNWGTVYWDYSNLLPELDAAGLRKLTGVADLTVGGKLDGASGFFAIDSPSRAAVAGFRKVPASWTATEKDETLNNILDWQREACAAFRYQKDGKAHDLLLLKPEAVEAYLTLLNESPDANAVFGESVAAQRILGYCLVPAGPINRPLLVVDTLLGDQNGWPVDEEDLLEPWPNSAPAGRGR